MKLSEKNLTESNRQALIAALNAREDAELLRELCSGPVSAAQLLLAVAQCVFSDGNHDSPVLDSIVRCFSGQHD